MGTGSGGAQVWGIVVRLLYEEDYLARNLAGYQAYCERVRFRLIPYVW